MKYLKIIAVVLMVVLLSGCGSETKVIYIYPKYQIFKTVKKIPNATVKVEDDNRLSSKSTSSLFSLVKALRHKERYYDKVLYNHNKMARKKNLQAKKYNTKHKKELDKILVK